MPALPGHVPATVTPLTQAANALSQFLDRARAFRQCVDQAAANVLADPATVVREWNTSLDRHAEDQSLHARWQNALWAWGGPKNGYVVDSEQHEVAEFVLSAVFVEAGCCEPVRPDNWYPVIGLDWLRRQADSMELVNLIADARTGCWPVLSATGVQANHELDMLVDSCSHLARLKLFPPGILLTHARLTEEQWCVIATSFRQRRDELLLGFDRAAGRITALIDGYRVAAGGAMPAVTAALPKPEQLFAALALLATVGANAKEIAKRVSVPRTTLLGWPEFEVPYSKLREEAAARKRSLRGKHEGESDYTHGDDD